MRTQRSVVAIFTACVLSCAALVAHAQDSKSEETKNALERRAHSGLVIGGKVGGGLGLASGFGGSPVFELELGVMLPLPKPVGHSLELFVSGQYLQPAVDGKSSQSDPRLPGNGTLQYSITEQQLALTLGVLYRLPIGIDLLMPYAAVGARLYMLRTLEHGTAGGMPIGHNQETASDVGGYFALGTDIFAGPGALLAELQIASAGVNGFILRNTNVGSFNIAVGYRLML